VTIGGAIKAAQKLGTPYISRLTGFRGRELILRILHDGSFGSCYPDGNSYMEHSFDAAELVAMNWKPKQIEPEAPDEQI